MNNIKLEKLVNHLDTLRYELGAKEDCVYLAVCKLEEFATQITKHKDLMVIEEVLELLRKI